MNHPLRRYALGVAFLCVSGIVQAHPGHTLGALDGIVHPVSYTHLTLPTKA